jgi:hypothetical protein
MSHHFICVVGAAKTTTDVGSNGKVASDVTKKIVCFSH